MISSRVRSWSPVALLLTVLLAVGGLSAPAQATVSRSVILRADATVVGAGKSVAFAGTLTKSPTGSQLRVQVKVGSYWLDSKFVKTTTASGAYRASVTMPTYVGTYSYRAVASATGGLSSAVSATVTITVLRRVDAALKPSKTTVSSGGSVVLTGHVQPCTVGSAVSLQQYTSHGWATISSPTLSSQCGFSRTVRPTRSTSYRLSVPRHGAYAPTFSAIVRITVPGPAPTITTTALPGGTVGVAYSQTLAKTGGSGTWSKSAGTLPTGISLSASTGKLSGTPSAAGTSGFTVRFTETATGRSATRALSITVAAVGPAIITASLPDATRGQAYSTTLTKTGAAGTWSISSGTLPSGISLDQASGVISGTATQAGDFPVGVTFKETSSTKTATKPLSLHVVDSAPPTVDPVSLPPGVKGDAYSQQLTATGNAGTWTVSAGTLPAGVTLSSGGLLAGTPTANVSDDYEFTVTYTETAAQTAGSRALVLHVSQAASSPVITTSNADFPPATAGSPFTFTLQASGSGTWAITRYALPPGLTLSSNPLTPGKISGTPTLAGDYTFQVKYTTLTGNNTKLLTLHVGP